MARLDFKLPDIGEGVAEAEIVEWHAAVGDALKEGQVVASVMTDKATVEMEAPADGTLLERGGDVGDTLAVGATLFAIDAPSLSTADAAQSASRAAKPETRALPRSQSHTGAKPATKPMQKAPKAGVLASPAVRQRARQLDIDLATIPASGDRLTHEDLDRYLVDRSGMQAREKRLSFTHEAVPENAREVRIVGLRRQIARRMAEAKQHIPHFTYVEEVDVTELERARQALNAQRGDAPALTILPFLCVATCLTLKDFSQLNAHYDDAREVLTVFEDVHLGIAAHTGQGLIVPVLRNADAMGLEQVAAGIADLANRGRSGQLARDELQGSTFTISSLGKLGGIAATPIINRPEVAILAPNRVVERIAMTPIGSAPRMIMNLSISCDHRVIDGHVAASFIQQLKRVLETPDF